VTSSEGFGDGVLWRVFVSHTSELRDFPRGGSYMAAVERAISAAGHVIVNMADFPTADQPAAELCRERVRGCDAYVGVLGTRYGSPVRDEPGMSYNELEFDSATAAGLPRLVFLLDTDAEDVRIPPSKLIDLEFGARQEAFRRRVRASGLVTQAFADPATLGQLVERSLREMAEQVRRASEAKRAKQAEEVKQAEEAERRRRYGIFISYRRQEDNYFAGRLCDRLTENFGADRVFIDVDTIGPGVDFTQDITRAVKTSTVLLAIIGPHWLAAIDEQGRRRLEDPDDMVRLEIETALAEEVRIIPILVDNATMPRPGDLPGSLSGLGRINAFAIRYQSFRNDAARLVTELQSIVPDR